MNPWNRLVTGVMIAALTGCAVWPWRAPGATAPTLQDGALVIHEGDRTVEEHLPVTLRGSVSLTAGDRVTTATVADVVAGATVTVLDPSTGTTVATGLTDPSGAFSVTLPQTWNPVTGSTYVIEAFKGLGANAPGQHVVRLRSVIKKLSAPAAFTSMTGTDSIGVNAMTTAVLLRTTLGYGTLPLSMVFGGSGEGTVTLAGALRNADQFEGYDVPDASLVALRGMITESVLFDTDPVRYAGSLAPQIAGLSSSWGAPGSWLSITGTGFSPAAGGNVVTFGSAVAQVLYASPEQLIVVVPEGATGGTVTVTTSAGMSTEVAFSASGAPIVTRLSQAAVAPGNLLTLTGAHFDGGSNTVTFTTAAGTASVAATLVGSQLSVQVPSNARSGPFSVSNAHGAGNGYWLDVFRAGGTITEDFSTTTHLDAGASNITWTGGVSPVGTIPSGGNLYTLADWDTLNPNPASTDLQNVQDGRNAQYPAGIQLSYTETSYPITNNSYIPVEVAQDQTGLSTNYGVATNGQRIVVLSQQASMSLIAMNTGLNDGLPFMRWNSYNAPFPTWAGASPNCKVAGLTNSNVFFYMDETNAVSTELGTYDLTTPLAPAAAAASLLAMDGATSLLLNKIGAGYIGGSQYGFKLASDGTYVYLLAGTGVVGGSTVYSAPVNLYQFRPDAYPAPSTLTLVRVLQNLSGPATLAFNQYTQMVVDRRGFYYPGYNASGTSDSAALYSLRTGAPRSLNVGFNRRNNINQVRCYDALNDVYVSGNYNTPLFSRDRFPQANFAATGSVTTPPLTLPAAQHWASINLVMDALPAGATVNVDVLNGAGSPIAGCTGLTYGSGISLQHSAVTSQANLKVRLTLSSPAPYAVTPMIRAVQVRTLPVAPMAQSLAYQIPGTDASDRVVIDSIQYDDETNGGTIAYRYATSNDGVNFSSFAEGPGAISGPYFKLQVLPSGTLDPTVPYSPPVTRRITFRYRY